jgi:hypothetical protein
LTIPWVVTVIGLLLVVGTLSAVGGREPAQASSAIDECIDPLDDDGDRFVTCRELAYGSDPYDALSTPEHVMFDVEYETGSCVDGVDNDLDGLSDRRDAGCEIPKECLGPLRSAFNRSGLLFGRRHPQTGETVYFGHFGKEFNPGNYRGTAGWSEIVSLLPFLARGGCQLSIPSAKGGCIDFSSEDPCPPGDSDNDGVDDYAERRMGSDPDNPTSTPEYALLDEQTGTTTCSDAFDNDLDGRKDRGDAGCTLTCRDFGTRDRCTDPDGDGWLTYVEERFGSDPNDAASTPLTQRIDDCIDFDNLPACPTP